MKNIIKEQTLKANIKFLKSNLLVKNQSIPKNYSSLNDYNTNFYYENPNNINIGNNTYRNKSGNLNSIISKINPPDERLIYCIKMLGLTKYYSNFSYKNLTFEEFLALTNEDMTKMRIPKNIQNIVQKFIMDYFNFGNLYTLDEIKNFFRKNKYKNEFYNQNISQSYDSFNKKTYSRNNHITTKNIVNYNYMLGQDEILNKYNIYKMNNYNKSVSPSKRNYLYQNQNISIQNMGNKIVDEKNINNNKHINYKKQYVNNKYQSNPKKNIHYDYDIDAFEDNHLSYNNLNMNDFNNENNSRNYFIKDEILYKNTNSPRTLNKYIEKSGVEKPNLYHQNAYPTQNKNLNEHNNIINLKNSNKNLYTNNLYQNYQVPNNNVSNSNCNTFNSVDKYRNINLDNYYKNNKKQKISKSLTRNKYSYNINERPLLSEGNNGMIMNNLNNYFIYNNYRSEDNPNNTKKKTKINKNQMNAIINKPVMNNIKIKNKDYLNKCTNRNKNNLNQITNNLQKLYSQNNINNTMLDYDKKNKILNNNNNLVQNQINNQEINQFREKKKRIIPNFKYFKNQQNNINMNNNNNLQIESRNMNYNILYNNMNYTDINDINNLNPNKSNLNLKYLRDKETRRNLQNKLPMKSISNLNDDMIDINKKYFQINSNNNKIYNIKRQYNTNYMNNNHNEKNFRNNYHSTKKLRSQSKPKEDYQMKFELLKKEINVLYNKMQIANNFNDINLNNLTYQKELLNEDVPNSTHDFLNDDNSNNNE